MARTSSPTPLVLWLRVAAIALGIAIVAAVGRVMAALSAPVDFGLAAVAVVLFAHRFERSDKT